MESEYQLTPIKELLHYRNTRLNAYNHVINAYFISSKKETCTIYQCTRCNKFFTSFIGQEFHSCFGKDPRDVSQEARDCYMDFVCCCNISQNAATGMYFQRLMTSIHADFITPSKEKFNWMLKEYAMRIQAYTLDSLKGEVISILIDGAKKCAKQFEGIIIYSHEGLKFLTLANIPDQKSNTLAELMSTIICILARNGTRVVSICSDNAKNNQKALNQKENSAQDLSGFFFIRQSCAVHSINLAINDVFNTPLYVPLLNSLKAISKFAHGPNITIRWSSTYDVAKFVNDNYSNICKIATQSSPKSKKEKNEYNMVKVALQTVRTSIYPMQLSELVDVLRIMQRSILCLEDDHSSIVDIFICIFNTLRELKSLPQHTFTIYMIKSLRDRAVNTLGMNLPLAAFLLTKEGLMAYRSIPTLIDCDITQDQVFQNAMYGIYKYLEEKGRFLGITDEMLSKEAMIYEGYLIDYLTNADPNLISYQYWIDNTKYKDENFANFSSLCRDLLTIPASEAAVERLFSHLQAVYNHSNMKMHTETINYRLCVKMFNTFKNISKPVKGLTERNFVSIMNCCDYWLQKSK